MRTNVMGILTWESLSWVMPAGWRSLLMVSHSSVDGSSQSTPHLWVHCMLMAARGRERPMKTERLLFQRGVAKERTCTELVRPGSESWFWPARLVVGGLLIVDEEIGDKYARMVENKGLGSDGEMEWLVRDINEGLILKSDGEWSIKALKDALGRFGGIIIPEVSARGESLSES